MSRSSATSFAQRLERRANVFAEELRLFPGGKVAADVVLLVIDEFGIGFLRPAPRCRIDLARVPAHADRARAALDVEVAALIIRIESRRRNGRVRQPVERDVIE